MQHKTLLGIVDVLSKRKCETSHSHDIASILPFTIVSDLQWVIYVKYKNKGYNFEYIIVN